MLHSNFQIRVLNGQICQNNWPMYGPLKTKCTLVVQSPQSPPASKKRMNVNEDPRCRFAQLYILPTAHEGVGGLLWHCSCIDASQKELRLNHLPLPSGIWGFEPMCNYLTVQIILPHATANIVPWPS